MSETGVRMGELAISRSPDDVLVSIGLGSCIGLAMVDRAVGVAVLAHVMLPGPGDAANRAPGTFADTAVPRLLDEVLRLGARRVRLEVVLVGGAQMFGTAGGGALDVGARNEAAVRAALLDAGVPVRAAETGGSTGRTIRVHVGEGRVTARAAGGTEAALIGPVGVPA
jgi:chemotaxis protein CheD